MVSIENSGSIHMYGLSTKAATNMISVDGTSQALDKGSSYLIVHFTFIWQLYRLIIH